MKYLIDNMFNGLVPELTRRNIKCETVIHEIWKDDDASVPDRPDAVIFRFLLERRFRLTPVAEGEDFGVITADIDLARYCNEFGLTCEFVPQPKPLTKDEFKELGPKLAAKLESKE